jgi:cyclopropane-fatty-acyl-phospholipid synthase
MEYVKDLLWSGLSLKAFGRKVFLDTCKHIKEGSLEVILPDKTFHSFGDANSKLKATLTILEDSFFQRILSQADIGFAEAFMDGDVQVSDLTKFLIILIKNRDNMGNLDTNFAWLGHMIDKFYHWRLANTPSQARANVSAHYDLSNEMFQTFLEPTMTYSCAFFKSENETLEQAQFNKIRKIIEKARIRSTDHVLEVGSGWGALAIEAVRMTGCRVTSLTLSVEQQELAQKRIAEAGLSDRIEIKLCDYRNVEGQFDRIISIEMIEQVGHEFLGSYFATCEKLLKKDGIFVLQAITMPDFRYDSYLKGCDFIQKYIFPGTCVPSITAMINAITQNTQLILDDLENIGPHYARTLRTWNENFKSNAKKIAQFGFDEKFQRTWEYYFCYCEAGFATRTLGDVQMVLTRTVNENLNEGIPL